MDCYNDNDRYACAWLRELIKDGFLLQGEVHEKDIKTLCGKDLDGYRRVHLFAGIGGWAYALELAGWPAERSVWTGSCPCQPFSAAGKRKGEADSRHLWPFFYRLVQECRPATIFGEQVSSVDGYRWLTGVQDDLEAAGYAFGAADLPACSQGAPHIRQRLFWVADAQHGRPAKQESRKKSTEVQGVAEQRQRVRLDAGDDGATGRLEHTAGDRRRPRRTEPVGRGVAGRCGIGRMEHTDNERRQAGAGAGSITQSFWSGSPIIECGDGKLRQCDRAAGCRTIHRSVLDDRNVITSYAWEMAKSGRMMVV